MATTNDEILSHLSVIRSGINASINKVQHYKAYNSEMTAGAKTASLATVTTVPASLQHASDCAVCAAWDGSDPAE